MRVVGRMTDALLWALAVIGGLGILTLMFHVVIDVIMRNVSNRPVPGTYEIVTNYYMIVLAFVPLAWVERRGGMVSVEVVDSLLPGWALRGTDIFVALFSAVVYGALTWVSWKTAVTNYGTNTFIMANAVRISTWPAFFLLPAGFGLACIVTLMRAVEKAMPERAA